MDQPAKEPTASRPTDVAAVPPGSVAERLGTYVAPGRVVNPARVPADAADAEAIGLGAVWISERWGQKDTSVLCGAMSQVTSRVRIGTAVAHPHTRHPLLLAGFGATMQALSGDRFVLGLGRSRTRGWKPIGLPTPTTESMRDLAGILRRLWAGETVSYNGPAGHFPTLRMSNHYEGPPPPLVIAAVGPRTLQMAGEAYDGVITRPFLTVEALADAGDRVRKAASEAGRDPASVRIVHCLVVAPGLDPEAEAAILGGRLVTYLQAAGASGAMLPQLNGWDPSVVERVRSHPLLASLGPDVTATETFTLAELAAVASDVIPEQWIRDGAAWGTPASCAARVREYLNAGADEILLHGNVPAKLAPMVEEFRRS